MSASDEESGQDFGKEVCYLVITPMPLDLGQAVHTLHLLWLYLLRLYLLWLYLLWLHLLRLYSPRRCSL